MAFQRNLTFACGITPPDCPLTDADGRNERSPARADRQTLVARGAGRQLFDGSLGKPLSAEVRTVIRVGGAEIHPPPVGGPACIRATRRRRSDRPSGG